MNQYTELQNLFETAERLKASSFSVQNITEDTVTVYFYDDRGREITVPEALFNEFPATLRTIIANLGEANNFRDVTPENPQNYYDQNNRGLRKLFEDSVRKANGMERGTVAYTVQDGWNGKEQKVAFFTAEDDLGYRQVVREVQIPLTDEREGESTTKLTAEAFLQETDAIADKLNKGFNVTGEKGGWKEEGIIQRISPENVEIRQVSREQEKEIHTKLSGAVNQGTHLYVESDVSGVSIHLYDQDQDYLRKYSARELFLKYPNPEDKEQCSEYYQRVVSAAKKLEKATVVETKDEVDFRRIDSKKEQAVKEALDAAKESGATGYILSKARHSYGSVATLQFFDKNNDPVKKDNETFEADIVLRERHDLRDDGRDYAELQERVKHYAAQAKIDPAPLSKVKPENLLTNEDKRTVERCYKRMFGLDYDNGHLADNQAYRINLHPEGNGLDLAFYKRVEDYNVYLPPDAPFRNYAADSAGRVEQFHAELSARIEQGLKEHAEKAENFGVLPEKSVILTVPEDATTGDRYQPWLACVKIMVEAVERVDKARAKTFRFDDGINEALIFYDEEGTEIAKRHLIDSYSQRYIYSDAASQNLKGFIGEYIRVNYPEIQPAPSPEVTEAEGFPTRKKTR